MVSLVRLILLVFAKSILQFPSQAIQLACGDLMFSPFGSSYCHNPTIPEYASCHEPGQRVILQAAKEQFWPPEQ
jgi:hypothetical protein